MGVNLLYVAWNRREFTEASFEALLANTNWALVDTLHVHDDGSTDRTRPYLEAAAERAPCQVHFEARQVKGPVAAMNLHLHLFGETEETAAFVKVDNDFVVCPGWLDELTRVASADPGVDFLGVQPNFGPPKPGFYAKRHAKDARHIGGIGLMRYRAFEVCKPRANGRYGFTEFQCRHPENRKAWVTPDLACFALDLIDAEPWLSLTERYIECGWQRPWSKYRDGGRSYYEWWQAPA